MSWSKDEWKQDLSPNVLQNITTLENELEMLQKHSHQQEIKLDSYMTSLEKEKNNVNETKALNAALQNEIQELMAKKSNLETKQEKLLAEVRNKENSLIHTEEILEKHHQKLKTETSKCAELQRSLGLIKSEAEGYAEQSEKLAAEVIQLKQEKLLLFKEKEGLQKKLSVIEKNNDVPKKSRESKPTLAKDDNSKENVLVHKTSSGEIMIDMMKKENSSLVHNLEDITKQRDQLRHLLEERDRDLERTRSKVTNLSVELQAAQETLKERGHKIHRLELTIETNKLDIMKLERDIQKYKTNAKEKMFQVQVKLPLQMNEGNEKGIEGRQKGMEKESDDKPKLVENDKEKENSPKKMNENRQATGSKKEMPAQIIVVEKEKDSDESKAANLPESAGQGKGNEKENGRLDYSLSHLKKQESPEKDVDEMEGSKDNTYKNEEDEVDSKKERETANTESRQNNKDVEQQTQIKMNAEDGTTNGVSNDLRTSQGVDPEINIKSEEKTAHQPQQEIEGVKMNEEETSEKQSPEETITHSQVKVEAQIQEKEKKDSTLEELMSLLIESLRTTREIRPVEPCIVQNFNQVVVLPHDNELRHERVVQSTQTMSVIQFDEECQTNTPSISYVQQDQPTTVQDNNPDLNNDVVNQEDSLSNVSNRDHFSQSIQDTLFNLQYEHERILKSSNECADIIITVREGLSMPELSVSALINRLANQVNSIGDASERCTKYVELLAREVSDMMVINSNVATLANDVPSPRDSVSSERVSGDSFIGLKKDLSWDNVESDRAFLQFKQSMDEVLKEFDTAKQQHLPVKKAKTSSRTWEEKKCRSGILQGQVEGYLETRPEKCCENDRVIESVTVAVDETNSLWFDRTQALFEQLKSDLVNTVDSQVERSINRCAKTLEKQQQDVHDRWVIVDRFVEQSTTRCAKKKDESQRSAADDHELFSDDNHVTQRSKKSTKKHDIMHEPETSAFASSEGQDAYQELENVKKRISHVQKIVQHLCTKSQVVEDEKDEAYAHIDRLSSHVLTLQSDHELRCKELEENLKSLSDREISLQRKCSHLELERDEIDSEMRSSTRTHQQKELELLKAIKKIRKMQTESEKAEAKLKSENEELRKQNCSIWKDYEATSMELEEKDKELKNLMGSMKNTEHSLISLFNTIGNIDDFLQRARDMNLFQ